MPQQRTRSVTRLKTYMIERAWAKYGTIFIEDKKGKQTTMQPDMLIYRLRSWNQSLSDEPVRRRQELDIIEMLTKVCREALSQKEDPSNTATASVTKAIQETNLNAQLMQAPAMQARIQAAQLRYPYLDPHEIYVVLSKEFPQDYERAMLKTINEDRMLEWEIKKKEGLAAAAARKKA